MRIGSLHLYWLAETDKCGAKGLMVGDYSGTSHAVAIDGLISLGLVKIKQQVTEEIKIVEITSSGKKTLLNERKVKKKYE